MTSHTFIIRRESGDVKKKFSCETRFYGAIIDKTRSIFYNTGMITVTEVTTKKQQKQFVEFPLRLYRNEPNFVPPLYGDEMRLFSPDYHYYDDSEAVYYLAERDGKTVGRISGILQRAANAKWGQKRVRFTRFDAVDDKEVAAALFSAVENWAREKGMEEVVGPLGFSDLEREGLLIEGFGELSTFEEQYNYPYYQALIEGLGYEKEVDWIEHKLYLPEEENVKLERICEKLMERYRLHLGVAKNTNEFLKKYADKFFAVLDESYRDIYGTVPFTDKMKKELIKSFRQIIDLRFVRVVLDENEDPVCLGLCFPSIAKAVQPSGGRLTLPTLLRILRSVKKPEILDLALVGVVDEYNNKGIGSVLITEVMGMMRELGVKYCETNLNLEENYNIINQWKVFRAEQHKRRRCFVKKL